VVQLGGGERHNITLNFQTAEFGTTPTTRSIKCVGESVNDLNDDQSGNVKALEKYKRKSTEAGKKTDSDSQENC